MRCGSVAGTNGSIECREVTDVDVDDDDDEVSEGNTSKPANGPQNSI